MTIIARQAQASVARAGPLDTSLNLIRLWPPAPEHLALLPQLQLRERTYAHRHICKPAFMMAEHTETTAVKPGPPQFSHEALTRLLNVQVGGAHSVAESSLCWRHHGEHQVPLNHS